MLKGTQHCHAQYASAWNSLVGGFNGSLACFTLHCFQAAKVEAAEVEAAQSRAAAQGEASGAIVGNVRMALSVDSPSTPQPLEA